MLVIRFRVQCRPEKVPDLQAAFSAVIEPSRAVEGVHSFDIAADLNDPSAFIATEVFADEAARQRQEALPEVEKVMALLPEALAAPPEATLYRVDSAEPAM
jgi:quinol monooxygenase YgiN